MQTLKFSMDFRIDAIGLTDDLKDKIINDIKKIQSVSQTEIEDIFEHYDIEVVGADSNFKTTSD